MSSTECYFTKEHEWVRMEGGRAVIGVTDYAQDQLGDIVFVELPEIGQSFAKGDVVGTIESVKTVSDVFAPLAGKVIAVNPALEDTPELVNSAPFESYIAVLEAEDPAAVSALMNEAQYRAFCEGEQ